MARSPSTARLPREPGAGREGGCPPARPPVSLTEWLGYEIPAAVQAVAKSAVQISALVQKPSATTVSLMLAFVTATGVSRTEGMSLAPLLTVLPFVIDVGTAVPVARS